MDTIIVALEISSTQITGIAGRSGKDGKLRIEAYATTPSSKFTKRGIVFNINQASDAILNVIGQLEQQLNKDIKQVYVGISGQSLHSEQNVVSRSYEEEKLIDENEIYSIADENRGTKYANFDILESIEQEYDIASRHLHDPIGVMGTNIVGNFLNIVAAKNMRKSIIESLKKAKIELVEFIITPLTLAESVIDKEKLRAGCALVDIGAETTTVSVYKKNLLRRLVVLPLGSNNVSKDICSIGIEEERAEEIKIKYNNAINLIKEDDDKEIEISEGRTIKESLLNSIIEARVEEIAENVVHQIQLSGYGDSNQLIGGIFICGNGAKYNDILKVFENKSQINKIKMISSSNVPLDTASKNLIKNENNHYYAALSILNQGKENCCEERFLLTSPVVEEKEAQEAIAAEKKKKKEKKSKGKRFKKYLVQITDTLFSTKDGEEEEEE